MGQGPGARGSDGRSRVVVRTDRGEVKRRGVGRWGRVDRWTCHPPVTPDLCVCFEVFPSSRRRDLSRLHPVSPSVTVSGPPSWSVETCRSFPGPLPPLLNPSDCFQVCGCVGRGLYVVTVGGPVSSTSLSSTSLSLVLCPNPRGFYVWTTDGDGRWTRN